jgi:hypothetical protein
MRKTMLLLVSCVAALGTAQVAFMSSQVNAAAATKRVQTGCCELRLPSSLRYRLSGDGITSVGGSLSVVTNSLEAGSTAEAFQDLIESSDIRVVSYFDSTLEWAVASGFMNDGAVFYIRTEFSGNCKKPGYLFIKYPDSKLKKYSSAVTTMSKTFSCEVRK